MRLIYKIHVLDTKLPFACDETNLYSNFLQVQNIMIIIVGYYFCTAYCARKPLVMEVFSGMLQWHEIYASVIYHKLQACLVLHLFYSSYLLSSALAKLAWFQ